MTIMDDNNKPIPERPVCPFCGVVITSNKCGSCGAVLVPVDGMAATADHSTDTNPAQVWLKAYHRPLLMKLMEANVPGFTGADLARLLTEFADYRIKPILDHLSSSGT